MDVDKLMLDPGPDIYYDDGFRAVLEDHMTYLRTSPRTQLKAIDAGLANQYQNDLYGLLQSSNVPMNLHWVVMRMNQYTSPTDTLPEVPMLLVPDPNEVAQIQQSYVTANRISQ